jgi:predicted nucleotidyltransferase
MVVFIEEHRHLLKRLVEFEVDFIIIGGYAVNFYGYNRPTGDMDIWLRPDDENKDKFIEMLRSEGFSKVSINAVAKLNFEKPNVFHLGKPPNRIDFLTKISRVDFDAAWKRKKMLVVDTVSIPVIHLHDLILAKTGTGRTRDKADIEELQKINRKRQ